MSPKLLSKLWSEGSILFYLRECELLHCMTVSFLSKWKLFLLELVLITWISKLRSVISSYIIFPLYVGSVPYSASSLVSLFKSVKRVHCDE